MKALVLEKRRKLVLRDIDLPLVVGPGEVKVEIWISPSSARGSSAVTISPGRHANLLERARCERTLTRLPATRETIRVKLVEISSSRRSLAVCAMEAS